MADMRGIRTAARIRALSLVAAVGVSSALAFGQPVAPVDAGVTLANTVIGAGGRDDSAGLALPSKLSGTLIPSGYRYAPVNYPATIALASSRDAGVPVMLSLIAAAAGDPHLIVVGYSAGSLVAERARERLQGRAVGTGVDDAPDPSQLTFVMLGSPFAPNGGLYSRFPGLFVPFVIDPMGPSVPTRYDTVYHTLEYDPFGDFPAYFNPVALLNSALALQYAHPSPTYDAIDPTTTPHVQQQVPTGAGGTDTYVLYRNAHLPLLEPLRALAAAVRLSPLVEPLLGAVEPLLRLAVDMAYTDRTYASVGTPTRFSLFTPPEKFLEAIRGIPAALNQGLANFLAGGQAPSVARPAPASTAAPEAVSRAPQQATANPAAATPETAETSGTAATAGAPATTPESQEAAPQQDSPDPTPARRSGLKPTLVATGNKTVPGQTPVGATAGAGESTATTDPSGATTPEAPKTPEALKTPETPETTATKIDPKPVTKPVSKPVTKPLPKPDAGGTDAGTGDSTESKAAA